MRESMERVERLTRIEWASLEGKRPWPLGRNARLPAHGDTVVVPVWRLTTSEGVTGFGPGPGDVDLAYGVLGARVSQLFTVEEGSAAHYRALDFALWDMAGKRASLPVYRLLSKRPAEEQRSVPCYDTSLYFEDVEPNGTGLEGIAQRACENYERGHRAFKVKVGRGARWLEPAEGLERDVAAIEAVRRAVGDESTLLADANNGFTLNGAREFLVRTSSSRLAWLEEPFHEDEVLLKALREWLIDRQLAVEVADCEGCSMEEALKLAESGAVDIVQCDILRTTFSGWVMLGKKLDKCGVQSAPHHFGAFFGNFVTGHLASAVKGLRYIEWDEAEVPALRAPGYKLADGVLSLSEAPGFGIELDDDRFSWLVEKSGFQLSLSEKVA